MSRSQQIKAAQRQVRLLKRPEDVHSTHWLYMQQVLLALCAHLPDVFPNQMTLAAESGLSRRAVQRALKTAEDHGLISRQWRSRGHWFSHGYQLAFATHIAPPRRKVDATTWRKVDAPSSNHFVVEHEAESSTTTTAAAATPQARKALSKRPTPRKRNSYSGKCYRCRKPLAIGEGYLAGNSPVCRECDGGFGREDNHDTYMAGVHRRQRNPTGKRVVPRQ